MRRKLALKNILSLSLLLFTTFGYSQEEYSRKRDNYTSFKNITVNDGLSANMVLDIIQDQYGIMWFATANGLTRYDGYEYTVYRSIEELENTLSNNFITSLAEDSYGNLWVGTRNGLNKYNRKQNRFIRYLKKDNKNSIINNHVKALHADNDGYLWVETSGGFLSRFDIQNDKWIHKHHPSYTFEGDYYYHHIFEDSKNNLWIGGRATSTIKVSNKNIDSTSVLQFDVNTAPHEASSPIETTAGEIMFGSYSSTLTKYNNQTNKVELVTNTGVATTSTVCDKNGRLWLGGKGGLSIIDLEHKEITQIGYNAANLQSLVSDEVFCLYKDHNDCIWIGTEKGISMYSENLNIFRHYKQIDRLNNGLTSNTITALMQDTDGLIWVGTAESGVDTLSMSSENFGNLTYSLLSQNIDRKTFEREKEVLKQYFKHDVISTNDKSLNEDYIFQNYPHFKQAPLRFRTRNENKVTTLYQDKNGKVYVGLWSCIGFNIYDKKKKEFKRRALWGGSSSAPSPLILDGGAFGANWYNDFLEDRQGNFWCATWEMFGLNLFDRKAGEFSFKHYKPGNYPLKFSLYKLALDSIRQRMVFGTGGYYGYYDFKNKSYNRYSQHVPNNYPFKKIYDGYLKYSKAILADMPMDFTCNNYIVQDSVAWIVSHYSLIKHTLTDDKFKTIAKYKDIIVASAMATDSTGHNIWVSTNNLLWRIDTKTDKIYQITTTNDELITTLLDDGAGAIWIGTKKGVFFYDTEKNELLFSTLNLSDIKVIKQDKQKKYIYLAHSSGLAKIKNRSIVSQYSFTYPETRGLPGTSISQMHIGSANRIWIGTNDGLALLDKNTDEIAVFLNNPKDQFSLLSNNIFDICEDDKQNLWITTSGGMCLLEHSTGKFIDLSEPGDRALVSRLATCLMQDRHDNIWIGTSEGGLSVLNLKTDRLKHYPYKSWNEKSISDNFVCFIFEDSRFNIWVGTRNGLNKFNRAEDGFEHIAEFNSYQTYNMQEDDNGNLWLSTDNGLFCLDSLGKTILKLQSFPGLQGNEFSLAGCKLQNGLLAFGGDSGFNIFNPSLLTNNGFKPKPIVFSNLIVKDSVRYFDLNGLETLNLSYNDNAFSISFCSTDYEYTNLVSYRYKLDDIDEDWVYTKAPILTAKYNSIPFGNHTFTVEVSSCFGEWVDIQKTLTIHIATPWYYQWWFILLLVLFIAGTIYAIIRIRERQLRLENIRLENIVEERTSELKETNNKLMESEKELREMNDSKNKFFSIISHDLRNPLRALNLTTRSLFEQYDKLSDKEKYNIISVIHKSTQQTGVFVENLLTWVISQMNMLKANLKKTELASLVDSNIEFMQIEAQKKNIRLVAKLTPKTYVWADDNLFSTILRNLVSNAIHYSFQDSEITISAKENNGTIEVSVTDQGVGISEENLERIFSLSSKVQTKGTDNEKGTGLGLIIAQEFVHLHKGRIWVESEVNKGSTFIFTLQKYIESDGAN